jgi:hypothetical protein
MTTPIAKIREDLELMVGGSFSPDALTPAAYDAILERVREEPKRYLKSLVQTYLGGDFDARTLSHLRLAVPLMTVEDIDAETTASTARLILRHIDGLLVIYDSAADKTQLEALLPDDVLSMHQRLDRLRMRLRTMTEGSPQ